MTEQRRLTWVAGLATFLAAFMLTPLFASQPWLSPVFVMIMLVSGVGFGGRALALPVALVTLLQLLGAALLLTLQFGPAGTRWWGLPTWETLAALADLAGQGLTLIERTAVPVPAETGVMLLTVSGVAVVAIAVDLLAVGLRLVPLAGLPLLAVYVVPVSVVRDGVPWLLFVIGASGFIGLLVTEGRQRLSGWGRSMGFSEREAAAPPFVGDIETGPVARVGRRIGAAALCLSVAIPLVVPTLGQGLISGPIGAGSGGRQVSTSDPFLDLVRDLNRGADVPVFSYTTDDDSPDYWRMTTLEVFDGERWQRADRPIPADNLIDGTLPPAPGTGTLVGRTRTSEVTVSDSYDARWLPLAYPTVELSIDEGRWGYDESTLNVVGIDNGTAGIDYQVRSLDFDYTTAVSTGQRPDGMDEYLELPALPPRVTSLATTVTAGATTPLAQAVALQEWFRDPAEFSYSLDTAPGNGTEALLAFLADRSGYCEQFASTMAIMARYLGIPTRVSVGFMPGTKTSADTWQVTTYNAHAWPELYIDGLGWTRFEPTPAVQTGAAPPWTVPNRPSTSPTPNGSSTATAAPAPGPTDRGGLEGGAGVTSSPGFVLPAQLIFSAAALMLLLLTPMLARAAMTRRRWATARTPASRALAAWALLNDRAEDLRYGRHHLDTPRAVTRRLTQEAGLAGEQSDALTRLASAAERVQFARDPGEIGDPRQDLDLVIEALTVHAARSRRLLARYLPSTTVRLVRAATERVADTLDWLESAGPAVVNAARVRWDGKA